MKRLRKSSKLNTGDTVYFNTYADGSLETVEATVIVDSGELLSVTYLHPLYPEAGKQIRCEIKKFFFLMN